MTSNKIQKESELISKSFDKYINITNPQDKIEITTHLLMYRFLSEIEKVTAKRGISRKNLADMVGVSPSYITQLYQGKKTISLEFLAKMQIALDITFSIGIEKKKAEKSKELSHKEIINAEVMRKAGLGSIANTRLKPAHITLETLKQKTLLRAGKER